MLKFYYHPGACSVASHIALEEAGADYRDMKVNIGAGDTQTPEFLAMSPRGFVPLLETDRGPLTENTAILTYIAQTYPEAGLLPSNDPFGAAQVTAFNAFLATTVHITYRVFSRPHLFADGREAKLAMLRKVPEMLKLYFTIIEEKLSDGREWVHGDRYSCSDPYLFIYASYLYWRGDRGRKEDFPLTLAHRERVLARPATQRALKKEGIGDPALYGSAGIHRGNVPDASPAAC